MTTEREPTKTQDALDDAASRIEDVRISLRDALECLSTLADPYYSTAHGQVESLIANCDEALKELNRVGGNS